MATCRHCAYLRKCIEKATKDGYEHNVDFDPKDGCPGVGFKSNTNADRIRAMSDEKLAYWIARTQIGAIKDAMNILRLSYDDRDEIVEIGKTEALKWLKQPAEDQ